ncbi:hypothetical protein B0H63DRAFT_154092 [Podospora didyma]|uniref:F-box domain-containing protein n=1 Tax=Podospora didyma TaxID=330526 RepID=A0AAE0NT64_9PEZI|nr:hypothetical protein B0H63DRAFT_154092 [Podospora didyma]
MGRQEPSPTAAIQGHWPVAFPKALPDNSNMPSISNKQRAVTQRLPSATTELDGLPVEVLIEILSNLDFDSLIEMTHVNKRFKRLFETNWAAVLIPILKQDFSPAEYFFRVFDVCAPNIVMAFNKFHDGDVRFDGQLVCSRSPEVVKSTRSGRRHDSHGARCDDDDQEVTDRWLTNLSSKDGLAVVLKACRAVKQWEREFQRLRFVRHPEHSRILHAHERERLRQSLYLWWRFARYFHSSCHFEGTEDVHRFWLRRPDSPDVRCNYLRQFSTTQLHELWDMWETIRAAVSREVCPSTVAVREESGNSLSRAEAARVGWGDPVENDHILATIMKLCPEDILHILVYRHQYATKASLVQFVRLRNPFIEDSIEMFSESIQIVLRERERMLLDELGTDALAPGSYFPSSSGFPKRYGGIIDHRKAATERLRDTYSKDAGKGFHLFHLPRQYYICVAVPAGRLVASS